MQLWSWKGEGQRAISAATRWTHESKHADHQHEVEHEREELLRAAELVRDVLHRHPGVAGLGLGRRRGALPDGEELAVDGRGAEDAAQEVAQDDLDLLQLEHGFGFARNCSQTECLI